MKLEFQRQKEMEKQYSSRGVNSNFSQRNQKQSFGTNNIIQFSTNVRVKILHGENHPVVPQFYQANPFLFHPIDQIIDYDPNVIMKNKARNLLD